MERDTVLLPVIVADGVLERSMFSVLPCGVKRRLAGRLAVMARRKYKTEPQFRKKLAACRMGARKRTRSDGRDSASVARDWLYDQMDEWLDVIGRRYVKMFRIEFTITLRGSTFLQAAAQPTAAYYGSVLVREAASRIALAARVPGMVEPMTFGSVTLGAVECKPAAARRTKELYTMLTLANPDIDKTAGGGA